eukprot:CAMPEP_0172605082 /NCGR_PEP_ID=MMETSP1068-20121228/25325_1 /TAXON_ID=35684 /ORGANISM="Pseudopedinella elastica, Strain CCMP716" /LENGTH=132 /DNA_ID=CAMNT_0013407359 /DNA_START=122 /DNA_END=520 /DNA_ORIENTATION=-
MTELLEASETSRRAEKASSVEGYFTRRLLSVSLAAFFAVPVYAEDSIGARRNPTDQWGGSKLGSQPAVKQTGVCASGFFTNFAPGKCTDIGDITKEAAGGELDSDQNAAADKMMARMMAKQQATSGAPLEPP